MGNEPTYRLDREGFDEHLLNADFIVEELKRRMGRVKDVAEASAPVYEQGPHPGRYKDSFSDVEAGKHGGTFDNRAYAILWNTAPEALTVEFGTENNDAHHTMLTALDAAEGHWYHRATGSNTARNERDE